MTVSATKDIERADAWEGFQGGTWEHVVDVRDFILANFTPYTGDASFLAGATGKTLNVWQTLQRDFLSVERERRVYDVETHIPGDVDAFPAGYISADDDVVVVTPAWPNLVAQPQILGARVRTVPLQVAATGAWVRVWHWAHAHLPQMWCWPRG